MASTSQGSRGWLAGLPRLLILRSEPGLTEAPVWLVWILGILALAAWTGLDRLRTGPEAYFSPYGVTGVGWYVLMLLAAAAALSWYSKPRVSLRSPLAVLLALGFILFLLAGVDTLASVPRTLRIAGGVAFGAYCILVVARMLKSVSGRSQPRAVLNAAFVSLFAWLATALLYVDPALWYAPVAEAADTDYSEYEKRGESLLFEQQLRIDAAVAEIVPPEG